VSVFSSTQVPPEQVAWLLNQFDALQGPSGQSWIIDVGPDATDVVDVADGTDGLASMPPELVDAAAQWLGGPPQYRLALTIGDSPACRDWRGESPKSLLDGGRLYGATTTAPNRLHPWGRGGSASRSVPARTPWPDRPAYDKAALHDEHPLSLLERHGHDDLRFRSCSVFRTALLF
jgi:hypothetical protein